MTNGKAIPITLEGILKYWPLLVIIVMMVSGFVVQQQMLNEAIHDIEMLEVKMAAQAPVLQEIQVSLAEIGRDLMYIKQQIGMSSAN